MFYPTYAELLFNILIWLLLLFVNFNVLNSSFPRFCSTYKVFFVLTVVFSTWGFITGDYFHYKEIFYSLSRYNDMHHLEPIYLYLAKILNGNYTIWRFVIWATSLLLYIAIMRMLHVRADIGSLCFALFSMFYFCSHRQTLAFCIVFLAVILLLDTNKKFLFKLLAMGLLIVSISFHRSMPIYIVLIIISLIPLNRYAYVAIICAFPLLYYNFDNILAFIVDSAFVGQDLTKSYIESDFRVFATIWGKIANVITQLPVYLLLIFAIYKTTFQRTDKLPYVVTVFLQMSFWQIYLSHLLLNQDLSSFLAPRFREDSLITMGIFYSAYIMKSKPTLLVKVLLSMLLFSNVFIYSYALYKL